jgi:hypothetical protein
MDRVVSLVEVPGVFCGKREPSDDAETILFTKDSARLNIYAYWTDIGEMSVSVSSVALRKDSQNFFSANLTGVYHKRYENDDLKNRSVFQICEVRDHQEAQVELKFETTTTSREWRKYPFRLSVEFRFKSGAVADFSHLFRVYNSEESAKRFFVSVVDAVPRDISFTRRSVEAAPNSKPDLSDELLWRIEALELRERGQSKLNEAHERRFDVSEERHAVHERRLDASEERHTVHERRLDASEERHMATENLCTEIRTQLQTNADVFI